MRKIKEAIVVEGNYDKIKLSGLFDTTIIVTDGFMIFRNKKLLNMIRMLAQKQGVIVLTDSDRAGFQIRNYIKNTLHGEAIKHAYIPDLQGKEKRKAKPSKEGFLGVEGVPDEIIVQAVLSAATESDAEISTKPITKSELYADGLIGTKQSHTKRTMLLKTLGLPSRMSSNMLMDVLNSVYGYDEYKKIIDKI